MRPRLLKITAFGPYAGEQIIDFSLLEDANMFLIHGPTGGGKTTILDAICYALYGETNGGERSGESMRSKFAKEDTITEIEFIFSLRNAEYKIIRRPQYERASKRGNGRVKVNSEVELYKKEEGNFRVISSKYNEVSEQVNELLHFNVGQFRQVIMIAQNKFRELLTVTSKERQVILQDIFETGIYQNVERKLDKMQSELKEQIKEKQFVYDNLMNNIEPLENENLKDYKLTKVIKNAPDVCELLIVLCHEKKEYLEGVEEKLKSVTESLVSYQKALGEATQKYNETKELETFKKEFEGLIKKEQDFKNIERQIISIEEAASLLPLEERIGELKNSILRSKEEIESAKEKRKQVEQNLALTKEKLEALSKAPKEVERLKKEYSILETYKPKMDILMQNTIKREELLKALNKIEKQLGQKEQELTQTKEKQEACVEKLKERDSLQTSLSEYLLKQKDMLFILSKKELIRHKELERQKLLKVYQTLKEELKTREALLGQNKEEYGSLFEAFMMNQAGELAQNLKEDAPCPVCGSIHHPNKAKLITTRVTKEGLESKEKENKKLEEDVIARKEAVATIIEQGKGLKQMIDSFQEEISGKGEASLDLKRALDDKVTYLKEALKSLDKVQEDYDGQKKTLALLEEQKENITKTIETQKLEFGSIETQIVEIRKDIPSEMTSKEQLVSKLEGLKQNYTELENQYKTLTLESEKLERFLEANEAALTEKAKAYEKLTKEVEEKNEAFQKALLKSTLESQGAYEESKKFIAKKQALKEALLAYEQRKVVLQAQIKELTKKVEHFRVEDLERIQKEHEALIAENNTLSLEKQEIGQYVTIHEKIQQEIQELYGLNNELVKKQSIIDKMSLVAKGKNKKGLSFERYIQSSIFEEVLKSANKKLRPMTQSRYELYRTDDLLRANAQAGLDIGIMDYYNNETRSVTTLSGGESFMAALALALGLADVVQRLAGATPLEAMFIDEGFGSLDEEALEASIKTLLNIQDTGRLIGIISHVRELKEQIPIRLEITTGANGSTAEFHV